MRAEWFHHCSACGKCCNSPPQLSVAELFHHQDTFFGCLTVQRLQRPTARDVALSAAFDDLAQQLWHRLPNASADTDDVLLATRGFDLGLSERCPALDDEQRCSLHERGKPAVCRVVPLDALAPNLAQHLVLNGRREEAHVFGGDCIRPEARPGFAPLTRQLTVVDRDARAALAARRRDLALERRTWGSAVFERLRVELFASPAALETVPRAGFMTLPIALVLMTLLRDASFRGRCLQYLSAQATLAERLLAHAHGVGQSELGTVRQLTAFARSNAALARQLKE